MSSLVTELGQNSGLQFPVLVSCISKQCQPPLKWLFLVVTGVSWGSATPNAVPVKVKVVPTQGSSHAQPSPPPCVVFRHLSSCQSVITARNNLRNAAQVKHCICFQGLLVASFLNATCPQPLGFSLAPESSDFCLVWNALIYHKE